VNASEWLIICKSVETKWGQSRRWDRAGDLAIDKMVTGLNMTWAEKAIDQLAQGTGAEHAPAPVKVLSVGHELQDADRRLSSSSLRSPAECRHPEPYGFTIEDETRIAFCRYCYAEWEAPKIKSIGEIAEAAQTRGVPE